MNKSKIVTYLTFGSIAILGIGTIWIMVSKKNKNTSSDTGDVLVATTGIQDIQDSGTPYVPEKTPPSPSVGVKSGFNFLNR